LFSIGGKESDVEKRPLVEKSVGVLLQREQWEKKRKGDLGFFPKVALIQIFTWRKSEEILAKKEIHVCQRFSSWRLLAYAH